MRSSFFPLASRQFAALLLVSFSLGFASCEAQGPFGLTEGAFRSILERGDRAAILTLPEAAFDNPGPAGPSAWYFTALWLIKGDPKGREDFSSASDRLELYLLQKAAEAGRGFVRSDARRRYVGILAESARVIAPGPERQQAWQALLDASTAPDGSDEIEAAHLEALAGLERWPELFAVANALLHDDIGAPSSKDQAALYARSLAASRLGLARAGTDLADLLSFGLGPWVAKGLELASEEENVALVPAVLVAKARLFQSIESRDYAAGYRASIGALPELRASPTRALVGAFGKAWIFSGMSKDGIALMDSVAGESGADPAGGSPAWTALFYKARMLAALSRPDEAATLLGYLADRAISGRDRDSCLYYALDARLKALETGVAPMSKWESKALRDKALAGPRLAAIEASAPNWNDPTTYTDLIEPIYRDLVTEGNWDEVDAFASRLSPYASPYLASRLLYVSGRGRELGLVSADPSRPLALARPVPAEYGPARAADAEEAERRYKELVALREAPGYYLLAASARLGVDIRPWSAGNDGRPSWLFDPTKSRDDLAATARALVDFGLPKLAWELSSKSPDAIGDEDLIELSKASAKTGSFLASMRFANSLADRRGSGYEGRWANPALAAKGGNIAVQGLDAMAGKADELALPGKELYELLYPRPWKRELESALRDSDIPEAVAFGLIRSESWFDPLAKSGAGAIGLSQLMPSTAAEIAHNLKIRIWSLVVPEDNLRLGMSMLHDLFDENDGHILRASFAYNAGRGRLRRWLAESGGYPDDLFLERLSIAETRDYGRKIVTATAWYSMLYYGKGSAQTVRELIAGYPTGK